MENNQISDAATVQARYTQLALGREPFLRRARSCSSVTIPQLIPPQGHKASSDFEDTYQSLGADGVNNLSSSLLMTLFPVNTPFFRLRISQKTLDEMSGDSNKDALKAEVQEGLANIEQRIKEATEISTMRVKLSEALKHILVGGNILLNIKDDGGLKFFTLNQYVVDRSPDGDVLEIIVEEEVSPSSLPAEVIAEDKNSLPSETSVNLYTRIYRPKNNVGELQKTWKVYQEVNGKIVPNSKGSYAFDSSPWLGLRGITVEGENYGRPYVEDYLGDLKSYEGLSKAMLEGTTAAAKIVFLVNPNGETSAKDLAEAESGDFREGRADDVSVLQMNKQADLSIANQYMDKIEKRIQRAFLMYEAIQRQGDRVTAEEIRIMASRIENGMGGFYSLLSQELQYPLVNRLMKTLKGIPKLPAGTVSPTIITGLDALGRGADLDNLKAWVQDILEMAQMDPTLPKRLKMDVIAQQLAVGRSVDFRAYLISEEEFQQSVQQEQISKIAEASAPDVIKQTTQGIMNGPDQPAQPSPQ